MRSEVVKVQGLFQQKKILFIFRKQGEFIYCVMIKTDANVWFKAIIRI